MKITHVVLIIALFFAGSWGGYEYYGRVYLRTPPPWRSLGRPPEAIERIIGMGPGFGPVDVYVKTDADHIYRGCLTGCANWERVDSWNGFPGFNCTYQSDTDLSRFQGLPGKVKQCIEIQATEWVRDDTMFVLLEDGTIRRSRFYSGMDTGLLSIGIGGLIGIVLGIASTLFLIRRSKRTGGRGGVGPSY
jgi:hypothetical protein